MPGFVKMCGVSAVLSFTLVTAYGQLTEAGAPIGSSKLYHQRVGEAAATATAAAGESVAVAGTKGDRLAGPVPAGCTGEPRPFLESQCISDAEGAKKHRHVRFITVESREGVNVSVLQRLPQTDIALR